jgi:hypothetical protein
MKDPGIFSENKYVLDSCRKIGVKETGLDGLLPKSNLKTATISINKYY